MISAGGRCCYRDHQRTAASVFQFLDKPRRKGIWAEQFYQQNIEEDICQKFAISLFAPKIPGKLAKFYMDVFEMQMLHKDKQEGGVIYLTDGYFNLAILPNHEQQSPNGLYHFGLKWRTVKKLSSD